MCLMANWLSAARAGLADFSVPPFGCGKAPIPPSLGYINGGVRKESACGGHIMDRKQGSAGRDCASMRLLTIWLPAARVEPTGSAFLPIGYCPPQEFFLLYIISRKVKEIFHFSMN